MLSLTTDHKNHGLKLAVYGKPTMSPLNTDVVNHGLKLVA